MKNEDYSESLVVHFRRAEVLRNQALELVSLDLNERQLFDLELILNRGFYPLTGFLGKEDYLSVLHDLSLSAGPVWPVPVCLDVSEAFARSVQPGQLIALNDQEGFLLATLTVGDIWKPDKKEEAALVYGTGDGSAGGGISGTGTAARGVVVAKGSLQVNDTLFDTDTATAVPGVLSIADIVDNALKLDIRR